MQENSVDLGVNRTLGYGYENCAQMGTYVQV